MNLALRMVESSCAGPTIGPTVNGIVTVLLDYPLKFVDDKGFG